MLLFDFQYIYFSLLNIFISQIIYLRYISMWTMCVYVCMYVCMYVRTYVRTYVRIYIYIYIYIYTCI